MFTAEAQRRREHKKTAGAPSRFDSSPRLCASAVKKELVY
jgi:hypothetical protein